MFLLFDETQKRKIHGASNERIKRQRKKETEWVSLVRVYSCRTSNEKCDLNTLHIYSYIDIDRSIRVSPNRVGPKHNLNGYFVFLF
jgi:hypothetical protein